jgi:FkbM family methyltransferase
MEHKKSGSDVYSQNDEETHILKYFANAVSIPRRFLEIGAFDPIQLSNTRALVERGWGGVYVEPAPDNAARFLREYASRQDILLVNAAVSTMSMLVPFYDSGGDALSTVSESHVEKWTRGSVHFTKYLTKTITLAELFDVVGYDFSFINLDVEGINLDLFDQLPFDSLADLRLLCVEHDGHETVIRAQMGVLGFHEISHNPENLIFGR